MGFESSGRIARNSALTFSLLKSRTAVYSLANLYAQSYLKASTKTLLHYRDYLVASALLESLVNSQYYDFARTKLTPHAERYWKLNSYDSTWTYLAPDAAENIEASKYGDLLGSVAYHFASVTEAPSYYPRDLLFKTSSQIWGRLGFSQLTANQKLTSLVNEFSLQSSLVSSLGKLPESQSVSYIQESRRAALTSYTLKRPGLQLLFGVYTDEFIKLRSKALTESGRRRLEEITSSLLLLQRPAGAAQLLSLVVVDALVSSIDLLEQLPESVLLTTLTSFKSDQQFSDLRLQLALNFALVHDAYSMLAFAGVSEDASTRAEVSLLNVAYWLESTNSVAIEPDAQPRLNIPGIYEGRRILLTDISRSRNPLFISLLEQPPRGPIQQAVVLEVAYREQEQVVVTTKNLFGQSVEADLAILLQEGVQPEIITQTKGSFTLGLIGEGEVAIVAIPVGSTPPDLQTYLGEGSELVASNPVVLYSDQPSNDIRLLADRQFRDITSTYRTALGLQNTSNPRGSDEDTYKARGLQSPRSFDYRSQLAGVKQDIYGARTENTERMVGLFETQDFFLAGALQTALDWAKEAEK